MSAEKKYTIKDLMQVMKDLRTPETGCPWDLEQDFKTIAPHTLEEAYEVADAIDRDDMNDLKEELGDLLFQSVYHAQMASEENHFDLHDVIHEITAKMIYRHPHVFGDKDATTPSDVNVIWEQQKDEKKESQSALDGITNTLPSLLKAQKLQKKAAKVGFEWTEISDVLDKLEEEITEMRQAIKNEDQENREEELGDILFLLANYARLLDINAEEALRKCNNKFMKRFKGMEEDLRKNNSDFSKLDLNEMLTLWSKQKNKV